MINVLEVVRDPQSLGLTLSLLDKNQQPTCTKALNLIMTQEIFFDY